MPRFSSAAKAVARLATMHNISKQTTIFNNIPIRCLTSITTTNSSSTHSNLSSPIRTPHFSIQKRPFLGSGDHDPVLSKVYQENRVLGYSPEQLFAVVSAVDLYEGFVPWCQRSKIIRRFPDGSFDAELEVGFKFLVESYVSHVEMKKPNYIKTTVSQSRLFDHLINVWEFNPGANPGTCNLYFLVDFKFQSPLYRQVAHMFFKEVVSCLVGSFDERCRLIYGPGVPVEYEQSA